MNLLEGMATGFGMFLLVVLGAMLVWVVVIWLINRKFLNSTGATLIWVITFATVTYICYQYQ